MKKDKKQKTRNRPTSTTPKKSDIHSVGMKTQKEETKAEELTKAEKIAIVTVIVSIITVIVSIVVPYRIYRQGILNKEIESLTESINNSTFKIKESFNPDAIEIDSLSSPDFGLVRGFQNSALNLACTWSDINKNAISSMSGLKKTDLDKLRSFAEFLREKGKEFDDERSNIMAYIETIKNYGIQNDIDEYKAPDDIMILLRIIESLNFKAMSIDDNNSSKNYDKNKVVKFIKEFEKTCKSKNNLEYTGILFKTIIELDERYKNHINDEIKKRQIF